MKKKSSLIIFIFFITLSGVEVSCKKVPGTGGRATIKGKIWVRQYGTANFSSPLLAQYAGTNQTVHIIYGDDLGESSNDVTDYNGEFQFQYLRKGSYKVYVYSADSVKCSTAGSSAIYIPPIAVVSEVTITEKKQTIDLGTITILKNK
ncbi:MAG: hypothetical protein HY063_03590 [Bacteroidetes bacterium]|nr:hypothetical protein [Bacteroidota bacterium]